MKNVAAFAPYCVAVGGEYQANVLCTHSGDSRHPAPYMWGSNLRRVRDICHKHHLHRLSHRDPCFRCPTAIER